MDDARNEFGRRLHALFVLAGAPPVKSVVRAANARVRPGNSPVTAQRISDWRRGNRVPATFESVLPVLEVLIRTGRTCPDADPQLLELARWHAAWKSARADTLHAAARTDIEPYPGLAAFRMQDAELYFGRDEACKELTALIEAADRSDCGLVVLLGASGAGKSSLLAAGLAAHPHGRRPISLTPGGAPEAALDAAADAIAADYEPVLLLVDQFEELLTGCRDGAERRRFVDRLTELARGGRELPEVMDSVVPRGGPEEDASETDPAPALDVDAAGQSCTGALDPDRPALPRRVPRVVVVIALNTGYLGEALVFASIAAAVKNRSLLLQAMTDSELRDAIVRPAAVAGLRVEDDLVDIVVRDVHSAASTDGRAALLPLLSHVLRETWVNRRGRILTPVAYRKSGEVSGAVCATAERVWSRLDARDHAMARRMLLSLTRFGAHAAVRVRLPRERLIAESADPPRARRVLHQLSSARLVLEYLDGVELLHESLFTAWPRMAQWVSEEAEFAPARDRLEYDVRAWSEQGRPAALLYSGARLDNAVELGERTGSLNRPTLEFLAESRRRRLRRRTVRHRLWALAAVPVVIAMILSVVLVFDRATVRQQELAQQISRVTFEAERLRDVDQGLSAQLTLAAYQMNPGDVQLQSRLIATQVLSRSLASADRHVGPLTALASGPDGLLVACGSDSGIHVWRNVGRAIDTIADIPADRSGPVNAVALAPDGAVLADGGQDGTVRLWDLRNPAAPRALGDFATGAPVRSVAVTGDGHTVLAGDDNGVLSAIDITDPGHPQQLGAPIPLQEGPIRLLQLDRSGGLVAAGGDTGIRLLPLTAAGPLPGSPLPGVTPAATRAVAFGSDGQLATGYADGTVQLWDARDPADPRRLGTAHTAGSPVRTLAFYPHYPWLVVGEADGTLQGWDCSNPGLPRLGGLPQRGTAGSASVLEVGPDSRVITAGDDGRVRVWSPPPGAAPITETSPLLSVDLDRAGRLLAVGQRSGTIDLWNVSDQQKISSVGRIEASDQYPAGVRAVLNPAGTLVAAQNDAGGPVRLWNTSDPARPRALPGQIDPGIGTTLAFGPRGRLLTGSGVDGLQLWDLSDPAGPRPLGQRLPVGGPISTVAFSPDGRQLALGAGNRIDLWNVSDWDHPVRESALDTGYPVTALAFDRDGRRVFSGGSDRNLRTWDISDPAAGRQIGEVLATSGAVREIAVDPSGHYLVSSGDDGEVVSWDITNPATMTRLGGAIDNVIPQQTWLRFDITGQHARLFGIAQSAALIWQLDPRQVAGEICDQATDPLTEQVWNEIVPSVPYRNSCPAGPPRST